MSNDSHSLPVPEWAKKTNVREKLNMSSDADMKFRPLDFHRVDSHSKFFAEWVARDNTLLVHLFPRNGRNDNWEMGHYTDRCRFCQTAVPKTPDGTFVSCPNCGRTGLLYIPGRVEAKGSVSFPSTVKDLVKAAADEVWMGTIAVDQVPELGAVAVQFQDTPDTPDSVTMLGSFFLAFEEALSP